MHPQIGILESGIAVFIPDDFIHMAKNLKGVVLFEKIAGIDEDKVVKKLYGKEISELKKEVDLSKEKLTWTDFVKKYKDPKKASEKWNEYKELNKL